MFILLLRITSKSPTHAIHKTIYIEYEVYVFVVALDSASDSIQWRFRLVYIDSDQDAKPIIILSKTLVKFLVKHK